eukprot:161773_1
MSEQPEEKWTRKKLTNTLNESLQKQKLNQILLMIYTQNHDDTISIYCGEAQKYKISILKSNLQMFGEAILDLSKMNVYDRIINIGGDEQLTWMTPLLFDEFTSLISFRSGWSIKSANSYNILCEMIQKDKMISTSLDFGCETENSIYDLKNKKFRIDTSKLINAIKSTNTLKEIVPFMWPGGMHFIDGYNCPTGCYFDMERVLKESLSLNCSVTSIIMHYRGGTEDEIEKIGRGRLSCGAKLFDTLLAKYRSWWPQTKKRNEEAQKFNKILAGDEKDDGNWNNSRCPNKAAKKILKKHFPNIPSVSFDKKGDRCFCWKCHNLRKDNLIYSRGKPPR